MHFPANDEPLILNGFEVDPRLAALMRRPDWAGKRTSKAWRERFPAHPECPGGRLQFVDLIGPEHAKFENANIRDPDGRILWGSPSLEFPPGDFDPLSGYLIGFTDFVDCGIYVDLRASPEPKLIYECGSPRMPVHRTAFEALSDFIGFYLEQHGTL